MVARLSELPAPRAAETAAAPGMYRHIAGRDAPRLALRGQLLLERAKELADVCIGGRGIDGLDAVPLRLVGERYRKSADCFIRGRVFAAIRHDGAVYLRPPSEIAADLVENGLCTYERKNLVTRAVTSAYTLEVNWHILLHLYWRATHEPTKNYRNAWSEFVIQKPN